MKKSALVILVFTALIVLSFAFTSKDEPHYKNLKVLPKNISKEQMDSVMHHFAGALGVKCSYCHAYNEQQKSMDFASDEKKEKHTAREMLHMMYKLNKKYFEVKNSKDLSAHLEITCYSCHHGSAHPSRTPPPMQRPGGPMPMPHNDSDSTRH